MGTSRIIANDDHIEGCAMYTALIGSPSTGKSSAMSLFRQALESIELFNGVCIEESKLVNGK